MFIGPLISGYLYDYTDFFVTMMTLLACALSIAIVLVVFGLREREQERLDAEIIKLRAQYNTKTDIEDSIGPIA